MAGRAQQIDDSFLDDPTPGESLRDDSFLDEMPDSDKQALPLGGQDTSGNWRMDLGQAGDNQGPPLTPKEAQELKLPLGGRIKYALAKLKAGEQLEPIERDTLNTYLRGHSAPATGALETANAHGANAAAFEFGDEALGYLRAGMEKLKGNPEGFGSLAEKEKFAIRDYLKRSADEHPWAAGLGAAGGGLASGIAMPAGKLANALQGAATGLGASEARDAGGMATDALGGAAMGHYGGEAISRAGAVAKGVARGTGSMAGRAMQLPGKIGTALEEWAGGKAGGGDMPINLSREYGDTSEQAFLKKIANEKAPVQTPVPGDANKPRPSPMVEQPVTLDTRPRSQHPAQKLEDLPTSESFGVLKSEDPLELAGISRDELGSGDIKANKDLSSDIIAHADRSMPVYNKAARQGNPDARMIQRDARAPTIDEYNPTDAQQDEYTEAIRRLGSDFVDGASNNKTPVIKRALADRPIPQRSQPADLNAPDRRSGYDARWKPSMGEDVAAGHAADYRAEFPNASDDSVSRYVAEAADHNNTDARYMDRKRGANTAIAARVDAPTRAAASEQPAQPAQRVYATPNQGETVTNFRVDKTAPYANAVDNDVTQTAAKAEATAQKVAPWDPKPSADARARLQAQAAGKSSLMASGKKWGGRIGASAEVLGGGGITGGIGGYLAGRRVAPAISKAIDISTEIGKHIQDISNGKMRKELFAQKLAMDPNLAAQMAQMPGKYGQAGQSILQALREGGTSAAKARAWVISQGAWLSGESPADASSQDQPSSMSMSQ